MTSFWVFRCLYIEIQLIFIQWSCILWPYFTHLLALKVCGVLRIFYVGMSSTYRDHFISFTILLYGYFFFLAWFHWQFLPLFAVFNPLTINVVIDKCVFVSAILLFVLTCLMSFVSHLCCLFSFKYFTVFYLHFWFFILCICVKTKLKL